MMTDEICSYIIILLYYYIIILLYYYMAADELALKNTFHV